MAKLNKNSIISDATAIIFLFLLTGLTPHYYLQDVPFNAEAGELACIDYDGGDNTITINCNASFSDIIQTITDPQILEILGNGEYILKANLEVADDITFTMTSNSDGLQYLKLASENGIIVYGKIMMDGVKITSWDVSGEDVIQQDMTGTIPRGYVQFAGSEGSQILNSEFGYLGYVEPGQRGFDLFGEGPSHSMLIRGSKFHDMWMAFYSREAYNITIDGNEYYNNILYALDPHTISHDMNITNNWVHHNPLGIICSDRCYNILIEGNRVEHNIDHGIYFSRNMHDSIARNNYVFNTSSGITVSESPGNQIYNNTIEGATSQGIRLFNPPLPPYEGFTENNLLLNNNIIESENGFAAVRSHDNTLENNRFSGIESSEYRMSGNSSMIIRGQHFDNALISHDSSALDSQVEVVDSGIIEVTEGEIDEGDEEEEEEEEFEGDSYNTDIESYERTLSNGDDITVSSP